MEDQSQTRWQRAKSQTRGFRAVRRELVGIVVTGVLTAVAVFSAGGAWTEALIGLGCAAFVTALLIPAGELAWNYVQADISQRRRLVLSTPVAADNEVEPPIG